MSNVLIGIIGAILFIGLAIGGATFFGPRVSQSTSQGQATVVITQLAGMSNAVGVRDRETETATQSGLTSAFLAPAYLAEAPRNPTGGPEPMLLDGSGDLTGPAGFAAMKIEGSDQDRVCREISALNNGPATVPLRSGPDIARTIGCFRINRDLTTDIRNGDHIAYSVVP